MLLCKVMTAIIEARTNNLYSLRRKNLYSQEKIVKQQLPRLYFSALFYFLQSKI